MPAYRFLNPAPVFFDLLGLAPIPGGSLTFYDRGTTDPKDTWSNEALTVINENPVPLDAGGRAETSIFLDGEYTVVCKNAAGETIWTRDVYPGGDQALTIPTPTAGYFLTSPDGVNLAWSEIFQMPDPTGSTGQYPVTDGSGYVLTNVPTPPEPVDPEIVVTTGTNAVSLQAGTSENETKALLQAGRCTATANNAKQVQVSVVYPIPFDSDPILTVTARGGGITSGNGAGPYVPKITLLSESSTGFTVAFNTNQGEDNSDGNIISNANANWIAIGTVEIAAE